MAGEATAAETAAEFESIRAREGVPYVENERTLPAGKFEALREYHESIEGVVMVGLVHEGAVLLQGVEQLSPPGGHVEPGDDWTGTARTAIEAHTGHEVTVEGVECAERTVFGSDEGGAEFAVDAVHYRATLAEAAPGFVESPRPPEEFESPFVGEDETLRLEWVEEVTGEVNPNHVDHVELYLDEEGDRT